MDVEIRVSAAEAQFTFCRPGDGFGYTIQIGDVEIVELPRWALANLYEQIGETLKGPKKRGDAEVSPP